MSTNLPSTTPADAGVSASAPPNTKPQLPALPPNVSIFSPKDPSASTALLEGQVFTRLTVSSKTEPSKLAEALRTHSDVNQSFCLSHGNVALVFDAAKPHEGAAEGVKDAHHEHVRAVCLALRDKDISLDIAGCVFDAAGSLQAGFQFDKLSDGAVMVIDLMSSEEDDDSDSEADLEGLLAGAEVVQ